MTSFNVAPDPTVVSRLETLVDDLPYKEQIPRRSGDVAFDHAWEIRAFSITTAMHADGRFEWSDFQSRLIESISAWEASNTSTVDWSYYERWMLALEALVLEQGMVSEAELDARTEQVLATPANANHQHAVREPITVAPPSESDR
ncbi:MAG: nitrile hydratase [Rhodococcus erythropolis]|jgi:nitrile hydratase|nr:nitrile hydratase [Rhodococcus erythropolis]